MTRAKAKHNFKSLGEIRKRTNKIMGIRDLNLLSSGTVLINVAKIVISPS
jgi:hypothetical protein